MIIQKDDIKKFAKEFDLTEKDSMNILFYMKAQNILNNKLNKIEDYIKEFEESCFIADNLDDLKDYYFESSTKEVEEFAKNHTIELEDKRLFVY